MAKTEKKKKTQETSPQNRPWIKKETGIKVILITSIAMAVVIATQTVPALGWGEGLLWALGYGALIWVIFYGYLFISRWLRR